MSRILSAWRRSSARASSWTAGSATASVGSDVMARQAIPLSCRSQRTLTVGAGERWRAPQSGGGTQLAAGGADKGRSSDPHQQGDAHALAVFFELEPSEGSRPPAFELEPSEGSRPPATELRRQSRLRSYATRSRRRHP